MPYEDVPTENAPAPPPSEFKVDLNKATIDDYELFDADRKTSNKEMIDFLERVIVGGVRGKGYPMPMLKDMIQAIGAKLAEQNNAKN